MIRMILYLLTMITTGYLAFIYPKKVVITLFILALLLFLPALFYSYYLSRKVRIFVKIPIPVAEKNQPADVDILVDNKGKMPLLRGRLYLKVKNYYHKGNEIQKIWLQADKKSKTSCRFKVSSGRCGRLSISIGRFYTGDMLGIFYFPVKKIKGQAFLSVMPQIESMDLEMNPDNRDLMTDSDEYEAFRSGDDPSEVFQIRSYRGGDRMQSIHWKMTARSEEVMVKEFSKPIYIGAVLFLDMKTQKATSEFRDADSYLEKALAVSCGLLESDCYHMVAWYDGSENCLHRARIESQDQIYEMIERLFRILPYDQEIDLEDLYHQEYPSHDYYLSYQLSLNLELWKGGGFSCRDVKKLL